MNWMDYMLRGNGGARKQILSLRPPAADRQPDQG